MLGKEIFGKPKTVVGYVQLSDLTPENFSYARAKGILDAIHLEREILTRLLLKIIQKKNFELKQMENLYNIWLVSAKK